VSVERFVERHRGRLILQPRMGFSDARRMLAGMRSVKALPFPTIGTITVDSFTRTGHAAAAAGAVRRRQRLNGYPLLAFSAATNRRLVDAVQDTDHPVQVRHGTPLPAQLFRAIVDAGIRATEGGPVSYCLPYGRTPLARSIEEWSQSCRLFAALAETGDEPHLESFGGCLLGQLTPPALAVAICILEGLFFRGHGIRSVSLSYAQGTNAAQDTAAIAVLRELAAEQLGPRAWHVVLYTHMGLFPVTVAGARALVEDSARLAAATGCERLIVKTAVEAVAIPTAADSVRTLRWAAAAPRRGTDLDGRLVRAHYEAIHAEVRSLLEVVLNLSSDLGVALARAFERGYLDVPYCLHPDNVGRAVTYLDALGAVRWADPGLVPVGHAARGTPRGRAPLSSAELLAALRFCRERYDAGAAAAEARDVA
jgi:methylaspartate mutase epsilon subunit